LLNALLGEDRVIVTPLPGTTRDVIEESINLNGLPVVVGDTAGIRETEDQIERMGIDFTRQHLDKADAVIVVLDGSEPLACADETLLLSVKHKKVLLAINKSDLPQTPSADAVAQLDCPSKIFISAKTGAGITQLKEHLRNLLVDSEIETPVVITNLRHRSALQRSAEALAQAAAAVDERYAPEFVAIDLNEARDALEEITGIIKSDDILERIFSNFCIGK